MSQNQDNSNLFQEMALDEQIKEAAEKARQLVFQSAANPYSLEVGEAADAAAADVVRVLREITNSDTRVIRAEIPALKRALEL